MVAVIECPHPKERVVHLHAGASGYACLACGAFIERPGDRIPDDLLEPLRALIDATREAVAGQS